MGIVCKRGRRVRAVGLTRSLQTGAEDMGQLGRLEHRPQQDPGLLHDYVSYTYSVRCPFRSTSLLHIRKKPARRNGPVSNYGKVLKFAAMQERRLGQQRRDQVLQRDESGDEEEALGDRLGQAIDGRGLERCLKDEGPRHPPEHHAAVRVQNRRPHVGVHRGGRPALDRGAEGGSAAPRGLHPLVPAGRAGYLEPDILCPLVAYGRSRLNRSVMFFFSLPLCGVPKLPA